MYLAERRNLENFYGGMFYYLISRVITYIFDTSRRIYSIAIFTILPLSDFLHHLHATP